MQRKEKYHLKTYLCVSTYKHLQYFFALLKAAFT